MDRRMLDDLRAFAVRAARAGRAVRVPSGVLLELLDVYEKATAEYGPRERPPGGVFPCPRGAAACGGCVACRANNRVARLEADLGAANRRVDEAERELEAARRATGMVRHDNPKSCAEAGCGCCAVGLVELVTTIRRRADDAEARATQACELIADAQARAARLGRATERSRFVLEHAYLIDSDRRQAIRECDDAISGIDAEARGKAGSSLSAPSACSAVDREDTEHGRHGRGTQGGGAA